MEHSHWQTLERRTIYSTKFLTLFEDTVKLPNGHIINDYSVVKKPDGVIVVATDTNNNLLVLEEYKYAVDQYLLGLPAGHIEPNLTPPENAKKELLEETGYSSDEFEQVGILYDYASKDMHTTYVFRAKNIVKLADTAHEDTETINNFQLVPISTIKQQITDGLWKSAEKIAALGLSGLLF
jgi:ADP-ribose pyrophosphatase